MANPALRPIPKSLKAWRKEHDGCVTFLSQLPKHRLDEGDKWVQGMIAYYEARLTILLKNKPRERNKRK